MLQGVLARQFYPYYFYPVGPFLAMLAAQIAFGPNSDEPRPTRFAFHPIVATAALAPLAVVMNLGFPYWDFIFTLIYNYSQGQWLLEGAAMIIFTAALTAAIVILAEYLYRRDTNAQPPSPNSRPNKADQTNC
jgi:ABC-type Fe3+ transport system permease subunit